MKLPDLKIDALVTIDFETAYSPKTGYTLSKMSTSDYVRDPRFQVIGVGVKVNDGQTRWMEEEEFCPWVGCPPFDWSRTAILAHNTAFDGFILAHHYGVRPAFWLDTLSMARPIHGTEVGGSLKKLSEHYKIGQKGTEVVNAMEKRREHFAQAEWEAYGEYCKNDCELTYKLFHKLAASPLLPGGRFPESELWLIDSTLRFFTEPTFIVDEPLLTDYLQEERKRKADLLARITADKEVLMSNDKLAALLLEMGVEPPKKISAAKSKTASEKAGFPVEVETFAFSKSDPEFQALLEHPEDEIRWLAEARVGVKSTLNETRTERFLSVGKGGRAVPCALRYYGAHTGRWSGG